MSMSQLVDGVQTARSAAERYAWREAYEAISLRERSYGGFSSGGDQPSAARLALKLADDHVSRGLFAVAHGWFANAERLLEGQPESAEHGLVALTRAVNAMFAEGNLADAITDFDRAFELAQRFGDRDTQMLA